jgi:hypothetical protein
MATPIKPAINYINVTQNDFDQYFMAGLTLVENEDTMTVAEKYNFAAAYAQGRSISISIGNTLGQSLATLNITILRLFNEYESSTFSKISSSMQEMLLIMKRVFNG